MNLIKERIVLELWSGISGQYTIKQIVFHLSGKT